LTRLTPKFASYIFGKNSPEFSSEKKKKKKTKTKKKEEEKQKEKKETPCF
jgi:hypothetical protein